MNGVLDSLEISNLEIKTIPGKERGRYLENEI